MTTSLLSFIAWAALMLGMVIGLFIATRRARVRAGQTEDVASVALPEIGEAAERVYNRRFGRAPTDRPVVNRTPSGRWYPPIKRQTAKHG